MSQCASSVDDEQDWLSYREHWNCHNNLSVALREEHDVRAEAAASKNTMPQPMPLPCTQPQD
jgi:hypothetical protein